MKEWPVQAILLAESHRDFRPVTITPTKIDAMDKMYMAPISCLYIASAYFSLLRGLLVHRRFAFLKIVDSIQNPIAKPTVKIRPPLFELFHFFDIVL